MVRYLLLSLAIHALVLLAVFHGPVPPSPQTDETQPHEVQVTLLTPGLSGKTPCETTFVGIGIMFNPKTSVIIDAPVGLPAHRAGVRAGDYLFDPWAERPATGPMPLKVRRDGQVLHFSIPPEDVCYS